MQQRSVRLSRCPDPGGADVLERATVSRAARDCTVIVHLAALAHDSAGSPEQIMAVNAMATRQNDLY
jgi:nucleoside-diphosphate-sugar epimerase